MAIYGVTTPTAARFRLPGWTPSPQPACGSRCPLLQRVCSPSRYALLTGRYHWRTRLQRGIVGVWDKPLIAESRLTIARLLRPSTATVPPASENGISDAIGTFRRTEAAFQGLAKPGGNRAVAAPRTSPTSSVPAGGRSFSRPIPGGPTTRGFHRYFGTDVPNWPPYAFISDDRLVGLPRHAAPPRFVAQSPGEPSRSGDRRLETRANPSALVDEALKFVAASAASNTPFLLYMPLTTPHTPLAVNSAWKGRSGLDSPVADLVMETDDAVGRVLDALDDAGVTDNTLVVFSSDNGFAPYVGAKHLESQGHFPSGPFRGYKADAYEGGHRVPFLARWPGVVPAGTVARQLVHHADLLPTLAEIWGVPLPENAAEDGFSLLPILRGGQTPVREWSVSCAANGTPSVRHGTWKLLLSPTMELYNLAKDPSETRNLAPEESKRVTEMRTHFEQLIANGRSNPGPRKRTTSPSNGIRNRLASTRRTIRVDVPHPRRASTRAAKCSTNVAASTPKCPSPPRRPPPARPPLPGFGPARPVPEWPPRVVRCRPSPRFLQFLLTPLRPFQRVRRQKELALRRRERDRPLIPPLRHNVPPTRDLPLQVDKQPPHHVVRRHVPAFLRDAQRPNLVRHILAVREQPPPAKVDPGPPRQVRNDILIRQVHPRTQAHQRHRPIHRPRIEVLEAQPPRQLPRRRALPRAPAGPSIVTIMRHHVLQ